MFVTILKLLGALTLLAGVSLGYYPPEQLHIALGATPDCMTFNWITLDNPIVTTTSIKWNETNDDVSEWTNILTISNATSIFIDNGTLHTTRTIHVINLCGLTASTIYYYQVGDNFYGWSNIYSFKTMPDSNKLSEMVLNNIPQKFIIYGDLGDVNAQTLSMITEEGLSNQIDMILHVGDFAYNFDTDNGTVGDRFMTDIEPLASHVPYMVSLGNHESAYNFSHYTERFRGMPVSDNEQQVPNGYVWTYSGKSPNNWYYSWNVGFIHFISISTEIYFDFPYMAKDQYNWLIEDLIIANKNRTLAPWIIINGHKPLYCSENGDCGSDAKLIRDGLELNGTYYYGLEQVFYQYGVDFYICGHEHNYERMYDIYQNKTTKSVTNMPATTYIVTGSAGCQEDHDPFSSAQVWDAFRTQAYSYTRFYVYNNSHIYLEQVVSDNTLPANMSGKVIDYTWYIQTNHGPFEQKNQELVNVDNTNNNNINNDKTGLKEDSGYFDVLDIYEEIGIDVNGGIYGISHKQRVKKENKIEIMHDIENKIKYLGDDKELYRGVPGVHF